MSVINKMLDWLVNHSDNAKDLLDVLGYYNIEQLEYWISYNAVERTLKHCLKTKGCGRNIILPQSKKKSKIT